MAAPLPMSAFPRLAWKTSLKLIPAWFIVISLLGVAGGMALIPGLRAEAAGPAPVLRVVESVVPLAAGLLAALVFSPESEPALEILLACRRPAAWALLERLGLCLLVEGSIALLGNLAFFALGNPGGESLALAVARWLAPCLFLTGAAAFVTQTTRQGVFGELLVMLMWGGMLFGGGALLRRFPWFWPLHVYLQPGLDNYAANRWTLSLLGIGLIALAALQTRDEQRMLGI